MTDEARGLNTGSLDNTSLASEQNTTEDTESVHFSLKKAGQTRANQKRRKLRSQRIRLRRR